MPESNDHLPSLDSLQRRIDDTHIKSERTGKGTEEQDEASRAAQSGLAEITRLAWGLMSGAVVGCGGGYGLDRWLGTSPLFLIAGFFIGFAAGLYNLMRQIKKDHLDI